MNAIFRVVMFLLGGGSIGLAMQSPPHNWAATLLAALEGVLIVWILWIAPAIEEAAT